MPASTGMSEADIDRLLVERFKSGDASAFDEIYRRYHKVLLREAFRFVKNHHDAQDMAQRALMNAYRGLGSFRGEAALKTWLFWIVRNLCINLLKHYKYKRRHVTTSFEEPIGASENVTLSDVIPSEASTSGSVGIEEFEALVGLCIGKLGPMQAKIVTLRYLSDVPYRDLAEALGINTGTVKSRLARARQSLIEEIFLACPELRGKPSKALIALLQRDAPLAA